MKALKAYSIQNSVSRQVSVQSGTFAPKERVLRKNVPLENIVPPWGFQWPQETAKQGSSAMKVRGNSSVGNLVALRKVI